MSSRMFQGVVLQMKDSISRTVGVVDAEGIVVACSELTCIGEHWPGAVAAINGADNNLARFEGRTFKPLAGWGAQFDYAAFVKGEDELAASLCAMAVVAFNGAKTYYEEKHDKATFVKNIISDNILLGDVYTQAKELHFISEVPRAAFLVRQLGQAEAAGRTHHGMLEVAAEPPLEHRPGLGIVQQLPHRDFLIAQIHVDHLQTNLCRRREKLDSSLRFAGTCVPVPRTKQALL